jgi:inorganic pyrophosphatase
MENYELCEKPALADEEEFIIEVFIEIAKNSHIKYEYDHNKNILLCDRVLHTPFKYLFNYGFVPETLSPDHDPLDILVLMDDELVPGCMIRCKIIGCLETSDDEGEDPKIIAFPCKKVDPTYQLIQDIKDMYPHTMDKIKFFFSHYKDLENKKVTIGNWLNKEQAIQIYHESRERYLVHEKEKQEEL